MKNLGNLMKQAKEMQAKMAEMQQSLEGHEETGESGAGLVKVTLNGKTEMKRIDLDPKVISADDKEMLEDLIVAAHNDAKAKIERFTAQRMKDMTGGIELPPGMQMPF